MHDELCQFIYWCELSCIATKPMLVILRLLKMTHTKIFFWQSSSPNSYLMSNVVTPGYKTARAWSRPLTLHSSAKVKKEGTYTRTPPICLHGVDSDSKDKAAGMTHKIICTNTHFLLKMGIFLLVLTIPVDLSSELGHHFTWLICTYSFCKSKTKDSSDCVVFQESIFMRL